jgi:crotonobetainyl-CoA:carnitine CoA-transferase CaiB-like acyl-CoA transferase
MAKLGLDYDTVLGWKPDIIYVAMPSFGCTGPYRTFQGFGSNVEALCGLTAIRGYADLDLRASTPVYYMDAASGAGAAFAVLCALHYRQRLARASSSTLPRRKICCRTSVSFSWMRRCMAVM